MKKFLALVLALTMVFALCACGQTEAPATAEKPADAAAAAEPAAEVTPVVLKISMGETAKDTKGIVIDQLVKEVEEATNGAITFEVYYSNELGALADVTEQTAMGANILAGTSGDFYASYGCPDITACALFYVFPDGESVEKFSESDLFTSWCDKIADSSGLRILCCNWAAAPRSIISTKPINSVEDIKNLKIRVPGLAADAFFSELGAATMTMNFSDVYTGMQQGMVEACEGPLSTLYDYSMHEVAKYIYLSEHSMAPCCWAMSDSIYQSLTPENQQILKDAFIKYGAVFTEMGMDGQADARAKLEAAGVTFVEPTEEDTAIMKAAGKASFDAFPEMTAGIADEIAKAIS